MTLCFDKIAFLPHAAYDYSSIAEYTHKRAEFTMSEAWDIAAQVITNLLLFFLVMGMASTVRIADMKTQLRNFKAIGLGLFCQFVLLPFIGFAVIMIFNLPPPIGITLIIVVSSPGGSYSNWWCSIFNADLALSVSMTTFSTILSVGFLPLNLLMYSKAVYGDDKTADGESIMNSLNFGVIFISISVVIGAIGAGMLASAKFDNPRFHKFSYLAANVSGIALILFSTVLSFVGGGNSDTNSDAVNSGNDETAATYVAIALPCLVGLSCASVLATLVKLPKPERLTTAVECCYQNTGIATSAALSLFEGDDLKQAMRVPFVYGLTEAFSIAFYLMVFWKLGWSKAPRDEQFCKVITKSYEIQKDGAEGEDGGDDVDSDDHTNGGDEEGQRSSTSSKQNINEITMESDDALVESDRGALVEIVKVGEETE